MTDPRVTGVAVMAPTATSPEARLGADPGGPSSSGRRPVRLRRDAGLPRSAPGVRTILVSSNPAAIAADPTVADAVYLEPLTVDD